MAVLLAILAFVALEVGAWFWWRRDQQERKLRVELREYVETEDLPPPPTPPEPEPEPVYRVTTADILEVVHVRPDDDRADHFRAEIERAIEDVLRDAFEIDKDAHDDDRER